MQNTTRCDISQNIQCNTQIVIQNTHNTQNTQDTLQKIHKINIHTIQAKY